MVADTSDEQTDALVEEVCALFRLEPHDRLLVHSLLVQPKASWPSCCGSDCQPCLTIICSAASEVLRRKSALSTSNR